MHAPDLPSHEPGPLAAAADDPGPTRPPLDEQALRRALTCAGRPYRDLLVVAHTDSTNADLAAMARRGAGEGLVLVAEHQRRGRGRLNRAWTAPERSGITVSVLLRPGADVPPWRLGWIPLLAGVAVVTAVRRVARVPAVIKWPNDVLVDERKLAGILAERVTLDPSTGEAVVLGIGLNVTLRAEERPVASATSLLLEGAATTDRQELLQAILEELASRYAAWRGVSGDPETAAEPSVGTSTGALRAAYRASCTTLGREVVVHLPNGDRVVGLASDVDDAGQLVIIREAVGPARHTAHGGPARVVIAAGDVVHVRAAGGPEPPG